MVADKGKKPKIGEKTEEQIDSELVQSVEKLQEVQDELEKINEEASDKVLEVEQKYNEVRKPVYDKRSELIKSIPDFWLTAFLSHPALSDLLNEEDQKIFKHLTSLEVEDFKDVKSGFSITFNFNSNPYFEDTKLTKTITFLDEGTTKITATSIKWKEGMGLSNGVTHEKNGNKRPHEDDSFFSWFSGTQRKDGMDDIQDGVAEMIKEDLWVNPLAYFNNDADEEEFGDEEDEEDIGTEDSEEDDDDDDDDDEHFGVAYNNRNKGKQLVVGGGDKGLVINMAGPAPLRSLGYVDPGWEHGIPRDERKKKVKCNYCDKIVSGGINRFKQHLARIPGEVAPCKSAPEEVYLKIKENMKWHRTGRRHKRPEPNSNQFYIMDDQDEDLVVASKSVAVAARDENENENKNMNMNINKNKKKVSEKDVTSAICNFFFHAGIPAQAANSPYFHKMLETVGEYEGQPSAPSCLSWDGCLEEQVTSIKTHISEYKASWAVTGCSILADSWKYAENRTLVNILVSSPRGLHFVSSHDSIDDAPTLFKCLDKVVDEIGEENVVQVVTQSTPAQQAAGKMLEEKRQNLFWTPCAASCIEQMLEDFVKIKRVAECIEKGQKVTKLIYNQIWLSDLMKREYTRGQELVKPSFTRHASSFLTLQSLMDHRVALKRLFQSAKWLSSPLSKSPEGEEVEKIVTNATFWKKVQYVGKSVGPVLQVLEKINNGDDSLSNSMAYVYNDMYKAKLAIKSNHGDDASKYGHFWSIIDNHPLYLAAYFLNPSYRYRPDFVPYPEVVRGLNSCIVRFEPNNARRVLASKQISDFSCAKADFGTDLAISTRAELNPAAWWQQHGINCLELQQIAVRILSQTCSSFGCEHNWSIYHNRRRQNRLAQKRLNDYIYVHYNLRLREGQIRPNTSPSSLDSVLQQNLLYDWIVYQEHESEMEYENGLMEESRKGSCSLQVLDVHHEDEDEEDDLNFLDDGLGGMS